MMEAYFEFTREKDNVLHIAHSVNDHCAPHFHSNIELLYVLEGEISVTINGAAAVLRKGDVSIAINYDIHIYSTESYSKVIILIVPCSYVDSFTSLSSGKTFASPFLIGNACSGEILHCLQRIFAEPVKEAGLKLKGYIYVILSLLVEQLGLIEKAKQSSDLPRQILLYLQEHYLDELSLSDISEKFGYSRYYFSRFFHTYFGCGFVDYINTLRVRHACRLLHEGKLSIMEIALSSGFESPRTFNRAFRKILGIPPTQYREVSGSQPPGWGHS